jgi:integrase
MGGKYMYPALKVVKNDDLDQQCKKNYINILKQSEPKTGVLFTDYVFLTVSRKSKRMCSGYKKNYYTLIHHINNFSGTYNTDIFTNSVNEEFLNDFIIYLENINLKQTYIKTLLSLVKAMARNAGIDGYAVDTTYDDVDIDDEEGTSIYLTLNEITRIYYFIGLTKKQQRIRDLFIVGCLTALRYSDYSTLEKDNFNGDFITKITKKTHKKVIIPIHDYVKEIYERYDGVISTKLSVQHFNRYLKIITKKIGLNDSITYSYTKGGKIITLTKEKWELISSHTARRSAATNMFLTGRFKTYEIMKITGHTTEKSFF